MSPVEELRLGIVGCGLMGSHYAEVFSGMDGVRIVACCDPTPAKLHNFGSKHRISQRYTDFNDMIGSASLNGILNVTPDYLHAAVASASMKAGIPLLTEKPLSGNLEEALNLVSLGNQTATPVLVNFSKRHCTAVQAAKETIQNGGIGEINRIEASYKQGWVYTRDWGSWTNTHAWTWRLDRKFSPQGVLGDLGSHVIDLVRYITALDISSVSAARSMIVNKEQEEVGSHALDSNDFVEAMLMLNHVIPVSFLCSRIDTGEKDSLSMTVYGRSGTLRFNLGENRNLSYVYRHGEQAKSEARVKSDSQKWKAITGCRPKNNYQRFIEVLRRTDSASPSLDDGAAVQKVMEAIGISTESGNAVILENLV